MSPDIPDTAYTAGIEGNVFVRVMVAASGKVISANLVRSSGNSALDNAALTAASSSTLYPMPSPNSRTIEYVMRIKNNK